MKRIFLFLFILGTSVFSQTNLYIIDFEKLNFNDGQPLPAEKHFTVQGYIEPDIDIVELKILERGINKPNLLYAERWVRLDDSKAMVYKIPVKFNLFYNSEYDILVKFYKKVSNKSKIELRSTLENHLDNYIDQVLDITENRVQATQKSKNIVAALNEILNSTFSNYTTRKNDGFEMFSDHILNLINLMADEDLEIDDYDAKADIESFKTIVKLEVKKNFESDLFLLFDKKAIKKYPTVKRIAFVTSDDSTLVEKKSFLFNIGYGAVSDGSTYQTNPFVGISIPIANERHSNNWLNHLSISIGIFATDFKNSMGEKLTGPIIKKPIYAGAGYSLLDYFRLHAGVCILQNQPKTEGKFNMKNTAIYIQFGMSLELNILAGFGSQSLKKYSYSLDKTYDIDKITVENMFNLKFTGLRKED